MIIFNVYCAELTNNLLKDKPTLQLNNIEIGAKYWLDGIDGFFDQFFEICRLTKQETIRFLILSDGLTSIPKDIKLFRNMPIIEAKIIENRGLSAVVSIISKSSLFHWASNVPLSELEEVYTLPEQLHPASELIYEAKIHGQALWVSKDKYWKNLDDVSAKYIFKTHETLRYIVIRTNATPSYLGAIPN